MSEKVEVDRSVLFDPPAVFANGLSVSVSNRRIARLVFFEAYQEPPGIQTRTAVAVEIEHVPAFIETLQHALDQAWGPLPATNEGASK